ncbi:hypothetical protein DENSPDRAFT_535303 [Dentipellis sp. KUC8613]|nr:hypothetical protein DENSPDRAFT_535303 [Dentipellis sp. KUC8613]
MPTLPTPNGLPHVSGDQRLAQRRRGTAERPKVYQRARSAKGRPKLDLQKHLDEQIELQRRKNDEVYASCLREASKLWEQIEDSKRERQHISDGVQEAKRDHVKVVQKQDTYERTLHVLAQEVEDMGANTLHTPALRQQFKATALAIKSEAVQVAELRQQYDKTEQAINQCKRSVGECRQVAKDCTQRTNAHNERRRLLRREARRVRDEAQSQHSGDQGHTGSNNE